MSAKAPGPFEMRVRFRVFGFTRLVYKFAERPAMMIVGVISDLHRVLSDRAVSELEKCDIILCAGDVERESILMELDAIAPTIAVKGNCDYPSLSSDVPFTASPRIGGVRFFMVHRPEDIGTSAEDVQVVVHGHTHVPRNQLLDGILYINPGSATNPRGGNKKTMARLTIEEGKVSNVEFVELN